MASLAVLPVEILLHIQQYFTKSTLNYFSQVCRYFYSLSNPALYQKNKTEALWEATETGNIETLRKLLEYCPRTEKSDHECNIWSPIGHTPMTAAVYGGSTEVVQTLIDSGFNPTTRDMNGYTPLAWAALYGHTDIIAVLLKTGIDPDQKDIYGRTSLSWAAEHGHVDTVKTLLDYGADPKCGDDECFMVEIRARRQGLDLIPLFMMNYAREYKGSIPRTALEWAERNNCATVVELLRHTTGYVEPVHW
ncbi:ankyrin repeat-containing domain protein [Aspergillus bertholletiae]|uniref:Ankyrin repeat-containing domain protein n=1 Tax=Aspergillus bertholletiae TaxID=1226010 RepID=A0A5N7BDL9_9EURO|nr:ankyrin repeat-containing domain protein [Aspergillus bertholletiae]